MLDKDRLHVYYINDGSSVSNQHYEYKMFNDVHNMKRSSDSVLLITCFSFDSFQPLKNWTTLLNDVSLCHMFDIYMSLIRFR